MGYVWHKGHKVDTWNQWPIYVWLIWSIVAMLLFLAAAFARGTEHMSRFNSPLNHLTFLGILLLIGVIFGALISIGMHKASVQLNHISNLYPSEKYDAWADNLRLFIITGIFGWRLVFHLVTFVGYVFFKTQASDLEGKWT